MLDILEWTLDVIGVTYRRLDGRCCFKLCFVKLFILFYFFSFSKAGSGFVLTFGWCFYLNTKLLFQFSLLLQLSSKYI